MNINHKSNIMKNHILYIILILLLSVTLASMTQINEQQKEPWKAPSKYEKMENPYAGVADDDKIGRILYSKHCKSCHGTKGKGDGNKAASIDTPIGDFTDPAFSKQSDGSLYYKTYFGRDDMPGFEKKITDEEERWQLINYLRELTK